MRKNKFTDGYFSKTQDKIYLRSANRIFFCIMALLIFAGHSHSSEPSKVHITNVNPLYKNLPRQSTMNSTKLLSTASPSIECKSDNELKSILRDSYTSRTNSFTIHLVYDFLFNEVSEKLKQTHNKILAEDDYLNLTYQSYNLSYSGYDGNVTVDYTVTYLTTYEQEEIATQMIDEILSCKINQGMDDAQKVKEIHDWIVLNTEYDISDTNYSAYSALISGKGLCQGYSLLTYKMLQQAGIPAKIINSDAMDHSWNMVYLCGNWYHIDCGWDDPVPDKPGRVLYTYYIMSDDQFLNHDASNHTWIAGTYPVAPQIYQGEICYDQNPEPCSYLTQTQVSQLYVSIFGRASEGQGNAYWMASQSDMVQAAITMLNTGAAIQYFGATLNDNQQLIEFIYLNTLGKTYADDPDGINYWVTLLNTQSIGQVVTSLINAAMDPRYAGLPAQNQFINKVAVSNYTAETIAAVTDPTDLSAFVEALSYVTDDPATVVQAKAKLQALNYN